MYLPWQKYIAETPCTVHEESTKFRAPPIAQIGNPCYCICMRTDIHQLLAYLRTPGLWLFACLAEAAVIFILSVVPSIGGGINGGVLAHGLAYSTLACTAGIYCILKKTPWGLAKAAAAAAFYGGLIELVQYFIPYRSCEAEDFAMNCAAALAGMALAGILRKIVLAKGKP